jgi:putative membrane protein
MTLDSRNLRTLVLLSWSGFLLWLWISGETVRYLGPRTEWLVPFGALALAAAAVVHVRFGAPNGSSARLSIGETAGYAALLLPILAGLLLGGTQLGALAASKKLMARGIDPSALAELAARNASELSFLQVDVAGHNPQFASENGIEPGRSVRLEGFVLHRPKRPHGTFELARFYITCCVADSVPIAVTIEQADTDPPRYGRDDWLSVSGELVRHSGDLRLRATQIERTTPPDQPYLSFSS